jgi:hypothetical protein
VTGNAAATGGGASLGTLNNCILSGNSALHAGGGVNFATLDGCVLTGNSTLNNGGGAAGSVLTSCTVVDNSANSGGGADSSTLTNCIVYYNRALAGSNYSSSSLVYCCTIPNPPTGYGNVVANPQLADRFHLSAGSPCIAAGNALAITGVDIDGEPWVDPPAIGADEFYAGTAVGQISMEIQADYTNLANGFAGNFTANINGHATGNVWDFGDGVEVTNQPYVSHFWSVPGDYQVSLRVLNESNPDGVSATLMVHVVDRPVQYVALGNTKVMAPYVSWDTAATNIQDAVDAAFGGGVILVSNGVYQTGGRLVYGSLTNRVVIDKAVTVQSVNGPAVTRIQGYQVPDTLNGDAAIRCVYLSNGASLAGFTLTNGGTRAFSGDDVTEQSGGGVWCESTSGLISNCIVTGNSCLVYGAGVYSGTLIDCQINNNTNKNSGSYGGGGGAAYSALLDSTISGNYIQSNGENDIQNASGGAFSCSLSNCIISGNSMGGADNCQLDDCIISGNSSAFNGGGADQCMLTNCLVCGNQTTNYGGGAYDCTLNSCVISNNWAGLWGGGVYCDYLQTNSPGQNNILTGNVAGRLGGGFYLTAGVAATNWNLNHWIFNSNSAASNGGGLYLTSPRSTLNDCTFSGNSSGGNGGGFSGGSPYLAAISNSTFVGNTAVANGGGAYSGSLENCLIVGNQAGNGGGVYGTLNNSVANNNIATTNGGGCIFSLPAFLPRRRE